MLISTSLLDRLKQPIEAIELIASPRLGATLALLASMWSPLSALPALLLLPSALIAARQASIWRGALGWWMAGFLLWLPFSQVFSLAPGWAQFYSAVLIVLPLAWLVGSRMAARGDLESWLTQVLPLLLLALALWGVWQGPNTLTGKPQGPFNDPNLYAACLNMLMLPVLAHWLAAGDEPGRARRLALLAILGAGLFVSFLVASRGAGVSLLLTLPILFVASRRQKGALRKWAAFVLVLVLAAIAANHIHQIHQSINVVDRLAQTVRDGDTSRWLLMQAALAMALDHPWLGIGLGGFRLLYPRYRHLAEDDTPGFWVHNDFLQLWVEAGLPMLLLFLSLAFLVTRWIWRSIPRPQAESVRRLGYLLALAAALLQANTNFIFYFSPPALLIGLYLARTAPPEQRQASPAALPVRIFGTVYGVALAYLLGVLVAVEILLTHGQTIQHRLLHWSLPYPRYAIAHTLSVLAPYLPAPRESMAIEAAADMMDAGSDPATARGRYISHLEVAQNLAPCQANYTLEMLEQLRLAPDSVMLRKHARRLISQDLDCNPRHGLGYFYAGWFADDEAAALSWWRAGLAASSTDGERYLLSAALLSRSGSEHAQTLRHLSEQLAFQLKLIDGYPGAMKQPDRWREAHRTLMNCCQDAYRNLMNNASGMIADTPSATMASELERNTP
ncbi:MAG: hypothetical protein B7Y41_14370 [Hydrogenophilales bacterium 28-61-23]|nr:MAG: hypothetical protein B7Y41_14370 [Hydrogenophilales bacterium 28-61-23]